MRASDRIISLRKRPGLHETFTGLRSRARGRHPVLDLALGVDGHIRRHLVPLAAAQRRILSYMEAGDLMAIDTAVKNGFPVLRRIAKNAAEHGVEHRMVFGFSYHRPESRTAAAKTQVAFLHAPIMLALLKPT